MADTHAGTCFCGAVSIEVKGVPEEMGYCHCSSCLDLFRRTLDRFHFVEGGERKSDEGGGVPRGLQQDGNE